MHACPGGEFHDTIDFADTPEPTPTRRPTEVEYADMSDWLSTRSLVCLTTVLLAGSWTILDGPAAELASGREFERRLELPISGSWDQVGLRRILDRVSETQEVALVLDRRIDPSCDRSLTIANAPLRQVLAEIAQSVSARISVLTNCVYLGPKAAAHSLRTVIELRSRELASDEVDAPARRRLELLNRQSIAWDDLTTPNEILDQIAVQFSLPISGRELIAHDLWAGCELPGVNAVEAVSLVLIQFDLTFSWVGQGAGMQIVPLPERVSLTDQYTLSSSWEELQSRLTEALPEATFTFDQDKKQLTVVGTQEEQEEVDRLLHPKKASRSNRPTGSGLERRRFTLRAQNARILDLLRRLKESDIGIEYDATALKQSRIDLERRVNLDLDEAPIEELLDAMFVGQRVDYSIRDSVITLKPGR